MPRNSFQPSKSEQASKRGSPSVISSSQFAKKNDLIQQSLTAATYLSQLVPVCKEVDVKVDAAAHFEVATTLWRQGETSTSVQMLQELCSRTDLLEQSIQIGRAGMLAQLVSTMTILFANSIAEPH
jgi:ataxia telangiectasia mutated family protein